MKTLLLKFIYFIILLSLSSPVFAAGSLTFVTYYPAPQGAYDRLTLIPSTLGSSCTIGTLQLDQATMTPQFCKDSGMGVGQWGPLSSTWTQTGNYVYPTQTPSNNSIVLGIGTGTTAPEFKLTLDNDGGILAKGTFGSGNTPIAGSGDTETRLLWYPKKSAFRVGELAGVAWDDANIGNYSTVLSYGNIASGIASVNIGGNNYEWDASETCTTSGDYSTILFCGPWTNNTPTTSDYATHIGFWQINSSCAYCTLFGNISEVFTPSGYFDYTQGAADYATGSLLDESSRFGVGGTISLGIYNSAIGTYSTIGGGSQNTILGDYGTISGGDANYIAGSNFTTGGNYATISGGRDHHIAYIWFAGMVETVNVGNYSVVGGGKANYAQTDYSTVAGGNNNRITAGTNSIITGGDGNRISGNFATILGGRSNQVSGNYSVVAGGYTNNASGPYSAIVGGSNNTNAGDYSLVAGYNMNLSASADHTFLWGYSATTLTVNTADSFIIATGKVGIHETDITVASDAILNIRDSGTSDYFAVTRNTASTPGDIFIVKNSGWIGIGKAAPAYPIDFGTQASGAHITAAGVWTTLSSRTAKENIKPLSFKDAEQAFNQLSPVEYEYRINPTEHHIGFIAEDMPALLAEKNHNSVNPMAINAVLTVMMQDHDQGLQEGMTKTNQLKNRLEKLEEKLK